MTGDLPLPPIVALLADGPTRDGVVFADLTLAEPPVVKRPGSTSSPTSPSVRIWFISFAALSAKHERSRPADSPDPIAAKILPRLSVIGGISPQESPARVDGRSVSA